MHNKKGFTLIEVLVVVVLIAIISMIAFPSFKKGREVSKNEAAKIKLLEVANAARLFNEDAPIKAWGKFGDTTTSTRLDPLALFASPVGSPYLKNPASWESDHTFNGYTYYICNPDIAGSQPASECVDGTDLRIVVMKKLGASGRYEGAAWVPGAKRGMVGNNYDMRKDVVY